MNEFSQTLPASKEAPPAATLKRRLVQFSFTGVVAVAFLGWIWAIGWVTVEAAKWMLS